MNLQELKDKVNAVYNEQFCKAKGRERDFRQGVLFGISLAMDEINAAMPNPSPVSLNVTIPYTYDGVKLLVSGKVVDGELIDACISPLEGQDIFSLLDYTTPGHEIAECIIDAAWKSFGESK